MNYPHLFAPIKIGNTLFRNRFFAAPTGHPDAVLGKFSEDVICYFEHKAKGGAAAVTLGEACIDSTYGKRYSAALSLDNRQTLRGLALVADAVRRHGAVPSIELLHPGMKATPGVYTVGVGTTSDKVYGPSAGVYGANQALEMPEDIIYEIIDKYANAAKFVKDAGFGMVMLHAGHGWLPNQFMCDRINKRTDKWGGSMENRARFTVEVIDAIHKACGEGFPVEVRISASEASDFGYGTDEGAAYAKYLEGHANLINCSVGCGIGLPDNYRGLTITSPSMFMPDGANVKYAADIKKAMTITPVSTVGALTDPAMMEEIIASGKADIVEVARGLICDPDLPNKAREGREDEIIKCMRCMTCYSNGMNRGEFWCALNPVTNRERAFSRNIGEAKKQKVLIVGGGVAGMQAAITAAGEGHEVILCEKSGQLGGHIRCEDGVPFKIHLKEYLDQQEKKVADAGVDIRLNTEVNPDYARSIGADVIIAALGAEPIKPDLPGINGKNVYVADAIYENSDLAGDSPIILGGGLVGMELAIHLHRLGKKVTVLEQAPKMNPGTNALQVNSIEIVMKEENLEPTFGAKALRIDDGGVWAMKDGSETYFSGSSIIYAVGQRSLSDETMALYDTAKRFYPVGDCVIPANIFEANLAAKNIALDIGR